MANQKLFYLALPGKEKYLVQTHVAIHYITHTLIITNG